MKKLQLFTATFVLVSLLASQATPALAGPEDETSFGGSAEQPVQTQDLSTTLPAPDVVPEPISSPSATPVGDDDTTPIPDVAESAEKFDAVKIDENQILEGVSSQIVGSNPSLRIVGGSGVQISQTPWQVGLRRTSAPNDFDGTFCGGSLLNTRWIITAAHCVDDLVSSPGNLKVILGTSQLSTSSNSGVAVDQIIIHPGWDATNFQNDIALVSLKNSVAYVGGATEPISLPISPPAAGTSVIASGWGSTEMQSTSGIFTPSYPTQLQSVQLKIYSDSSCQSYLGSDYDSSSMLCAGDNQGFYKDTCQGDSGGPLASNVSGTWRLEGIVSWGEGCAWLTPGVYTRVQSYSTWISNNSVEIREFGTVPDPVIYGRSLAKVGVALSANVGTWPVTPSSLTYKWVRSDGVVLSESSTAKTYTPGPADVGYTISLTVTGSKPGYETKSVTSSISTRVIVDLDTFTSAAGDPLIYGRSSAQFNGVLSVGNATSLIWSPRPDSVTYSWVRSDGTILKQSSSVSTSSYTLTASDVGFTVSLQVTARKSGYYDSTLTSSIPTRTVTARQFGTVPDPVIYGRSLAKVGVALSANVGTWPVTPSSLTYKWVRSDGVVLSESSTAKTYTPGPADVGYTISLTVTGSKPGYETKSVTSSISTRVIVDLDTFTSAAGDPLIYGRSSAQFNGVLSVGNATSLIWSPRPDSVTYSWVRSDGTILKQSSSVSTSSYTLTASDVGFTVSLQVTARKSGYYDSTLTSSIPTRTVTARQFGTVPDPVIYGRSLAKVGVALSANVGTWPVTPSSLTYKWVRSDGVVLSESSTAKTYTPGPADVGYTISLTVTGSKPGYETKSVTSSISTRTIVDVDSMGAVPDPVIYGRSLAKVGVALSANVGTWPVTPSSLTYKWVRSDGVVLSESSTAKTYTPAPADLGYTISLTVTGSKPGYETKSVTSSISTRVIQPGDFAPMPKPRITNGDQAAVGSRVYAGFGNSSWSPSPDRKIYKWIRDDGYVMKESSSEISYVPTDDDYGHSFFVSVTVEKSGYNSITSRSDAASPVLRWEQQTFYGLGSVTCPAPSSLVTGGLQSEYLNDPYDYYYDLFGMYAYDVNFYSAYASGNSIIGVGNYDSYEAQSFDYYYWLLFDDGYYSYTYQGSYSILVGVWATCYGRF